MDEGNGDEKTDEEKLIKYTLYGFIWGFKTWIQEVLRESNRFWIKEQNVVPRGVSWRVRVKFFREHWDYFFGHNDNDFQQQELSIRETALELQAPFWIASTQFFANAKAQ